MDKSSFNKMMVSVEILSICIVIVGFYFLNTKIDGMQKDYKNNAPSEDTQTNEKETKKLVFYYEKQYLYM